MGESVETLSFPIVVRTSRYLRNTFSIPVQPFVVKL